MICKCPECGFCIDVTTVAKAIEMTQKVVAQFDYGEPEFQCPNCQKYFRYKPVEEHAKDDKRGG